jgi:hypothetical protein
LSALVIATFNGKPTIFVDHVCARTHEKPFRTVVETVPLSEIEAALSLAELRGRWAKKALLRQRLGIAA